MNMTHLDDEEREILDAFEREELKSIADLDAELEKHREVAKATFKKD